MFPSFLPDDRHVLYFDQTTKEVFAGSLDSVDEQQRVLAADPAPAYAPPGYILFVRQGTLLAQQFDAKKLRLSGEPVLIAEGLGFDLLGQAFSVSENAARRSRSASNCWLNQVGFRPKLSLRKKPLSHHGRSGLVPNAAGPWPSSNGSAPPSGRHRKQNKLFWPSQSACQGFCCMSLNRISSGEVSKFLAWI
jgi:hypothetical protein